ncbi:hypothetical protein D3C78_1549020 [compost metagenome]
MADDDGRALPVRVQALGNEEIALHIHLVLILEGDLLHGHLVALVEIVCTPGHIGSHCGERTDQKSKQHDESFHWIFPCG